MNEISAVSGHVARMKLVLVAIALTILAACSALYVSEFTPRYATMRLNLPKDTAGSGWITTEHAVLTSQYDEGRVFVWSQDSELYFADPGNNDELATAAEFLDHQLRKLGWVMSGQVYYCDGYLPDQQLLVNMHRGLLLEFHERDQPVFAGGHYFGDLVCLSVLKDTNVIKPAQQMTVTLLTARQSWLRLWFSYWSEVNY